MQPRRHEPIYDQISSRIVDALNRSSALATRVMATGAPFNGLTSRPYHGSVHSVRAHVSAFETS